VPACAYHEKKMMRAKPRGVTTFLDAMKDTSPSPTTPAAAAKEALKEDEWEVRPGGMLVQKRGPDADAPAAPVPTIRVKVKHNGVTHEIYISAEASFGNAIQPHPLPAPDFESVELFAD
jgi:hypothetical protein